MANPTTEKITTINPENNEVLAEYPYLSSADLELKFKEAHLLYQEAKKYTPHRKSEILFSLEKSFLANVEEFARMMALEMGKPILDGREEVKKCAATCKFFAEKSEEYLKQETLAAQYNETYLHKQGLGIWLAVMPWNFPLWQVVRALVPNILAGQPMFLKHASLVTGTALLLEKVIYQAANNWSNHKWLTTLVASHEQIESVVADSRIVGVSFTGSTMAGKKMGELSGRHLKKSVLELGGSDPYVVFADSDLQKAAKLCAKSRLINNGQSCISAKRFIVEEKVYSQFLQFFQAEMDSAQIGSPLNDKNTVGPLASKNFQKQLSEQCAWLEKFAEKLYQRESSLEGGAGSFFMPRIYRVDENKIPTELRAFYRALEFFGPVSQILTFRTEEEAIDLANNTDYGLGAAVFTENKAQGFRVATELIAGTVAINDFVRSDARSPFGGMKDSGYGKELSYLGFLECAGLKVIGQS